MRVRYQTNPKVAAFGMAVSLGLIFGAHEVQSVVAEQEAEVQVHMDAAGQAETVMTVEPAAGTVAEAATDRRC